MRVIVDDRYYARALDILGRAGEREFRKITCDHPSVPGAQIYKLRFELSDECCYELDITSGEAEVPYSLLARAGFIKTQFIATAVSEVGNYELIAKSNVFYCVVGPSIDSSAEPIPTYEEAQLALERLQGMLKGYEAKSMILTEEQYTQMGEHDPKTVYYVTFKDKVSAYLGDALISGGGAAYDVPNAYLYKLKGEIDIFGETESEE